MGQSQSPSYPQPPFSPWCSYICSMQSNDLVRTHRFNNKRVCSMLMCCSLFLAYIQWAKGEIEAFPSEPSCQLIRKSYWDDHKVRAKLELSRAESSFLQVVPCLLCMDPCWWTSVLPEMRRNSHESPYTQSQVLLLASSFVTTFFPHVYSHATSRNTESGWGMGRFAYWLVCLVTPCYSEGSIVRSVVRGFQGLVHHLSPLSTSRTFSSPWIN